MINPLVAKIFDTEDINDENIEKDDAIETLTFLLKELSKISSNEWDEIFNLMNKNATSNSKINVKESYIVATSKIIIMNAREHKIVFNKVGNDIYVYSFQYWQKIEYSLLIEFLKTVANKLGIPENIASYTTFLNNLYRQFVQDSYFKITKRTDKEVVHFNFENGIVIIDRNGIRLEAHHPKYFLTHKLDFIYEPFINNDKFLGLLNMMISSKEMQRTMQESIAQLLTNGCYNNNNQICFYNKYSNDFTSVLIDILQEIIPHCLQAGELKDLFFYSENISKNSQSFKTVTLIECENVTKEMLGLLNNYKVSLLHWLIDGAGKILKNGRVYISPECEEFKKKFNLVSRFISESNLIKTPKDSKSIISTFEDVHRQYVFFCELHDEEALSKTMFNRELKELGFVATRRESGNGMTPIN